MLEVSITAHGHTKPFWTKVVKTAAQAESVRSKNQRLIDRHNWKHMIKIKKVSAKALNDKREQDVANNWLNGYAVALAEMHRRWKDSSSVCEVARDAGLNLKTARIAKVSAFDLKELKRAGLC